MRVFGIFLAIASAIALTGMIYLAFFFVKNFHEWEKAGTALPVALEYLVELTHVVQRYGFFLVPGALITGLIGIALAVIPDRDRHRP